MYINLFLKMFKKVGLYHIVGLFWFSLEASINFYEWKWEHMFLWPLLIIKPLKFSKLYLSHYNFWTDASNYFSSNWKTSVGWLYFMREVSLAALFSKIRLPTESLSLDSLFELLLKVRSSPAPIYVRSWWCLFHKSSYKLYKEII